MPTSRDTIDRVETLVSSPGRNYVTVRVTTRDGLVGLGDATLNGRELAVSACIESHLAPMLLGRDPDRIEDTWQYLYKGAYWRHGGIGMAAIAAIDMALWDIKARRANAPLYQLLGGASRDGLLAYAHAFGADLPELHDAIGRTIGEGYTAVRVQSGIPGVRSAYGVGDSSSYEPAGRGSRPVEESWSTPEYLRHIPRVFDSVRAEFGDELHLLHDAHHRLTPTEAARVARDLEPHRLFWLEDLVPSDDPSGLRDVRQHSVTPLAIGEVFTHHVDAHRVMQDRLVDYLRVSVTHGGGITPVRRMMDFAGVFHIRSACHGPSDISPIGFAAALHLGLALPNFGIQESMGYAPVTAKVFDTSYRFDKGFLHPGDEPGLGVRYDADAASAFEYEPAYLPVNRLVDGTMHHW